MTLRDYLEMVLPVTNMLFVTQDNICQYVDINNIQIPIFDHTPNPCLPPTPRKTFRIDFNNKYYYFKLDQKIKKNQEDIIVYGDTVPMRQFRIGTELKQFIITFIRFQPIIVNI